MANKAGVNRKKENQQDNQGNQQIKETQKRGKQTASQQFDSPGRQNHNLKATGIDRLLSILSKNGAPEIESVAQAGNNRDSITITFTDGEILLLTAEKEVVENPDSTNFV